MSTDLCRIDTGLPKERAHLLKVVMLLEYFHRDAVSHIVPLELGVSR